MFVLLVTHCGLGVTQFGKSINKALLNIRVTKEILVRTFKMLNVMNI